MKTSHLGEIAIEGREGIRLTGYKDSKGLPTIGVGHLIVKGEPYKVGGKITQSECDKLFAEDLEKYENTVNDNVKVVLEQHQFDACVSLILNIGIGGFKKSTVLRLINRSDFNNAANAFMLWNKPKEIKGRRRSEQKQFLTPYPV